MDRITERDGLDPPRHDAWLRIRRSQNERHLGATCLHVAPGNRITYDQVRE